MMSPANTAWVKAALVLVGLWLGLVLILHPSFQNMAAIWGGSTDTYSYGYVILPISLWLLWRERHYLMRIQAAPDWRALILVFAFAMIWLLARISGVQVLEQYAFVAIAISLVPLSFGWAWFQHALFPFLFLLVMVPNGDFLLPSLIEYTADFTTFFVQAAGVPIFRDGPYLSLPTGEWQVVEACGGLRYLTASITLGLLYAYLTYRTFWKRLAFSVAIIVAALLANGLRAVMIVLVGHYSNMTMMIGEDHIWFGWGWYGVVILTMFWIGSFWREDPEPLPSSGVNVVEPRSSVAVAVVALAGLALFPLWENSMTERTGTIPALNAPGAKAEWISLGDPFSDWAPNWTNPDTVLKSYYEKQSGPVMLYVAYYAHQRENAELTSHNNQLHRALRGTWQFVSQMPRTISADHADMEVMEVRLRDPASRNRMLVWQWYQLDDQQTANFFRAKTKLIVSLLLGKQDAGATVVLATPYSESEPDPDARLKDFLAAYSGDIRRMLAEENH
jgi:exosortase A